MTHSDLFFNWKTFKFFHRFQCFIPVRFVRNEYMSIWYFFQFTIQASRWDYQKPPVHLYIGYGRSTCYAECFYMIGLLHLKHSYIVFAFNPFKLGC